MTAQEFLDSISDKLITSIKLNKGLTQFAIERSKFEGWLKVELINILLCKGILAKPEIDRIDVTFKNTAIELKTVNTSYRYKNVKTKTRPITKNIDGILKDISDLKKTKINERFVIFIVFPVKLKKPHWDVHLGKIEREVSELACQEFEFENSIPALIYCCKV